MSEFDVFDKKRYFAPGDFNPHLTAMKGGTEIQGHKICVSQLGQCHCKRGAIDWSATVLHKGLMIRLRPRKACSKLCFLHICEILSVF